MLEKWFEIISNHKISLRERLFRLITSICMIALICTMPMGKSVLNWCLLLVSLVIMAFIVKVSIQKECINTGATAIVVLLLLLFPETFFTAGGFYSGMPSGSCSVSSISALPWREGGNTCFSCSVRWRRWFVIGLPFIIRNWPRRRLRNSLFLPRQFPSSWWDF